MLYIKFEDVIKKLLQKSVVFTNIDTDKKIVVFTDKNGKTHTWILREDGTIYEEESGEIITLDDIEHKVDKHNDNGIDF